MVQNSLFDYNKPNFSNSIQRKITLTYQLCIAAVVVVDLYIPFFIHNSFALGSIALINLLYIVVMLLNYFKSYNFSRLLLTLTPSLSAILICYSAFRGANVDFGCKLTILSTIILPLVLIDIRDRLLMFAGILIVVIGFCTSEWIGIKFINPITNPQGDASYAIVFMTALLDMGMFSLGFFYLQRLNIKAEVHISNLLENEKQLNNELIQKKKSEINEKIAEFKLIALRAQMNPHFIFNALNSVQYYIMKSDKEAAYNYLSKFAVLIRKILENAQKNTTKLSDELNMLRLYMELEAMRFSDRFDFNIEIDSTINIEETEIPSMVIQPYVENAIIHGLLNKTGKGKITVKIKKEKELICIIEDNGTGRKKAAEIKNNKSINFKSYGMDITKQRLEIINTDSSFKTKVNITDLYDQDESPIGTKVEISIPLNFNQLTES